KAGRVEIDGATVTRLGTKIDPGKQRVSVDGRLVRERKRVYYILNKPVGFECTSAAGKKRAIDLVPDRKYRLYTVGRLDVASEGLIIVTNDGELAQKVAHPRHGIKKVYEVIADGELTDEAFSKIRKGVWSGAGKLRFENVTVKKKSRKRAKLEMALHEGKNREIRRALAAVGLKVRRLRRIRVGEIKLGGLAPGMSRIATAREIAYLESLQKK
ncbi:MAG: pseudouridine synthase, partial [Planctomycetota bacterium]